ncbi:hypothetical protein BO79DRAFT_186844 [Aspergillus costaricaensis CBS 115574]|uniref:Uncharacterized protein n=1 Tax=Aspergillus costaricaensis CBS 115574 TaxID=1448317 RepID=A0ACD1IUK1_9EURO|nr:hypothetical protein BO79DRAFT_186844 [Aspergillus costaricaensis CBS 115574]RAK93970.1 hypothetical protein BO79DRAFT_186844 [Aspergillus costaricaensis CBS 115574]
MSTAAKTTTTYRALLRELPRRTLSTPTPLQHRLRDMYISNNNNSQQGVVDADAQESLRQHRLDQANQFAIYAKAQRVYAELVERYNPGTTLDEEERIRLTARRVGWDLPVEAGKEKDE